MIRTAVFFFIYMMVTNVSLGAYGEHANNGGPDRTKRATDIGKDLQLIFAQGPTIKQLSLNSNTTHTIVNSPYSPHEAVHLDVDCRNNLVFWAVNGGEYIYRAKWERAPVSPQRGTPWINHTLIGGLAYDWIREDLYWTDTKKKKILTLQNQINYIILYYTPLEPGKIVLDPLTDYLFWVENDLSFDYVESRIVRGPLSKTDPTFKNRRYIVEGLSNVNSLTLDYDHKMIYWIQVDDSKICSADYYGKQRRTLSHYTDSRLLLSITYFQNWLYWSQLDKVFNIYKIDTENNKTIQTIRSTTLGWRDPEGGYGAMQICQELRQKMTVPFTSKPDVDPNDTVSNESKEPDLVFAQGTNIKQWSLVNNKTTRTLVTSTVPHREAAHLDVDCQNNRVFYAVSGGTSIYMGHWSKEQKLSPSTNQLLINSTLVGGVAYNWLNDSIYWTDSKLKTISKTNPEGKDVEVLYRLELEPAEIVLVPQSRMKYKYILWSANYILNGNAVSNIMRAPLRGQYIQKPWEGPKVALVQGIPPVKSLTLDYDGYRIYWAQIDDGKIRSTTFTGTDPAIKTAVQLEDPKNRLLLSIAYFQDWLYWTEFDNVFFNIYKKHTKGRIEKIRNTRQGWLEPEGGYGAIQICHALRQAPETLTAN